MDAFRVITNGEDDDSTAENSLAAFRQVPSPSQPWMQPSSSSFSQLQPETRHRVNEEEQFGGFPNVDLQTLESSFGILSVLDSSFRQQNPVLDNRRSNPVVVNQGINGVGRGGRYWFPPPNTHREIPEIHNHHQLQRLTYQNDCVNRSYGFAFDPVGQTSTSHQNQMLNNGFLNGYLRDIPYLSRNRFLDQTPWDSTNVFGSCGINDSWRSNEGFGYNHENGNGKGSFVALVKDRISSVKLQKMIDDGSKETIDMIYNDVVLHICDLMVDPFGHSVFQKLVEKCSSQRITQILGILTQHEFRFVRVCTDSLGTRSIQSLMKCLHSEDQIVHIVDAVSRVAFTLTKSNNAKHVILQCFDQFSPSQNRNLLEMIARNCCRIATDQHGCCMLQKCLDLGYAELKHRLIAEIIANALRLCVDCYGNYVVQYLVVLNDQHVIKQLVSQLVGHYGYLSRNKYGSHAVQKFLNISFIDSRVIVCDLLTEIDALLVDPFGNYVIQTAWSVSEEDVRKQLLLHIGKNIQLMSCNKYGKKILEKLKTP